MGKPARVLRYYLGGGLAAIVGYFVLVLTNAPPGLQVGWYVTISASGAAALAIGVRLHRPRRRAPWYCLAIGQGLYAAADLVFYLCRQVLGIEAYPFYDDLLYLSSYPMLAIGLLLFVRGRTPGWDLPSLIDSTIISVVAGLLMWTYLIRDIAVQPGDGPLTRALSIAYPAMDLLMLAVAVRLWFGAGARLPVHRLLYFALLGLSIADITYSVLELIDGYEPGGVLEGMWLLVALALGGAGLHPSMRALTDQPKAAIPDTSSGRLVLLSMASTCAPALLLVERLRGAQPDVVPAAVACMTLFPLTLARMATMVGAQRRMATTDPITGLRTRRYFDEQLSRLVTGAHRAKRRLGLLMLDVDHFKRVNDTYGHEAGDMVLAGVGEALRRSLRLGDLTARYGGEEFAALVPDISPQDLLELAERVRHAVSTAAIATADGAPVSVTVSVGVASLSGDGLAASDLVRAADVALYAAKRQGRNRTIVSQPPQAA